MVTNTAAALNLALNILALVFSTLLMFLILHSRKPISSQPRPEFSFSSSTTSSSTTPYPLFYSSSHPSMRTSILRKYYLSFFLLKYAGPSVVVFTAVNAMLYFQTSWQSYRLQKITTAAAQGILEPVGVLLKELQNSEEGKLPDFELEAENARGVKNRYTFRLVDGKVEMVKEESMDGVVGLWGRKWRECNWEGR
jgi:hypothetical protein